MTTLLLPPDEVARVRTLKGQVAYILAIMILLDRYHPGCAFTPKQVSLIAGMDERTADKQLQNLSTLNRVILSGSGYVLTEGGRAMFLPAGPIEALALSPEPSGTQAQALQTIDLQAETIPDEPETPAEELHTNCVLLEEEDINSENINNNHPLSRSAQNVQAGKPTTVEILNATDLLWGKTMTTDGLEDKPRRAVIGWVAQAWDQRKYLRSPQGLIYARLAAGKLPQEKYYDHPRKFLPRDYLAALGLAPAEEPTPTTPEIVEPETDPEPKPEVAEEFDGSLAQQLPNCRHSPASAWNVVLDQLRNEMHSAPFQTWVAGSEAIRFQGCTLTVGVRNQATVEWLDDRIRSTAERLLVGITCQSLTVKFVVQEG